MSKDNDFVSNFEKASLDWYNSTDNNGHPIKSNNSIKTNNSARFSYGERTSLFAFIVLILFTIAFSHYIRTGTFINFSFKSLIDYLSGMPDISISFAQIDLTIYADWGVFNFLKSFFNFFTSSFEVLITLTGFISQGFVVIWYLLGLLFL